MSVSTHRPAHGSGFRPGGRFASRRAASGFSLVEVLLATLVVGTLLAAATGAIGGAVSARDTLSAEPVTAFGLAREVHSLALVLPRDAGDGLPAARGADVALLEDLDGATFSPPVSAARTALAHATGWSQEVTVEAVDLAAPGSLAADASAAAVLLRLTVVVREGADLRGTYVWWLNP
ncbi:MAG: prepilin-type N-terminal cleavage/methylation domain-containing protein [Planctomycetes bacterium]|nr:prepilin-type N-terminal cleavage/methylation domain-containing protein [Planctomycetota bacterium]